MGSRYFFPHAALAFPRALDNGIQGSADNAFAKWMLFCIGTPWSRGHSSQAMHLLPNSLETPIFRQWEITRLALGSWDIT